MSVVVLLTGGNLGNREANIRNVRAVIAERVGDILAESSVRESEPWGFEAQERFLNQVLIVITPLLPEALLDELQQIEKTFGRERSATSGYASRTMDIDILYYEDLVVDTPRLSVPHPRIAEREFVLTLLDELMPQWRDPRTGRTINEMLESL